MNDGIQYLSTATNWLQGQGFSTNALIYNPHFQGELPAPQTVWPPGLSMLQVVAGGIGIDLQVATLAINLFTTALSGVLVFLILRRCGSGQVFSLCCAALFYFSSTSWHLAVALLSEPLFTCLILSALYYLPSTARPHMGRWALCGLFIAACIVVRYSGVFTAAAFGVALTLVLLLNRNYRDQSLWQKFWKLVLLLALPVIAFAALMLRTHYLVGTIDRNTGIGDIKTLGETIKRFAEEVSMLTGFRDGWFFSGDVDTWLFFVFVFLIAVISLVALLLSVGTQRQRQSAIYASESNSPDCYTITVVSVVIAHAAAFGGYLAWCSMSNSPLNVTPRYLYQIYPGLFILFCLIVSFAITRIRQKGMTKSAALLNVPLVSLALLYLIAQVNMIPVIKEFSGPAIDVRDSLKLTATDNRTVAELIRSCVGDKASPQDTHPTSLWSNEGIPFYLHTGVHTITLTQIYTTTDFDFERLESDIAEYNIRLFVFINNSYSQDGNYGLMLESIKRWLLDKQYSKVELADTTVASGTSVEIFSVGNDCLSSAL